MLRNLHPLIGLLLLVVSSVAQGTAPAAAQAIATTEAIPVEFLLAPLLQPGPTGPANGMTHPALGFTWTAQGSNQAAEKAGGEKAGKPAVIDDPYDAGKS